MRLPVRRWPGSLSFDMRDFGDGAAAKGTNRRTDRRTDKGLDQPFWKLAARLAKFSEGDGRFARQSVTNCGGCVRLSAVCVRLRRRDRTSVKCIQPHSDTGPLL